MFKLLRASGKSQRQTDPAHSRPVEALEPRWLLANPVAVIDVDRVTGLTPLAVTFDARDSHDDDNDELTFIWDFGDDTGPVPGAVVEHLYIRRGVFDATLTVIDENGDTDTEIVRIFAGETPPSPQIFTPGAGQLIQGKARIFFSGFATDAQDVIVPERNFVWTLSVVDADDQETVLSTVNRRRVGRFKVPANINGDPAQTFRVTLTVTDSAGLEGSTFVDLEPQLVNLNIRTNFPGLMLLVDDEFITTSAQIQTISRLRRTLSAPATQTVDGVVYRFVRWTTGGSRTQTIQVGFGRTAVALYEIADFSQRFLLGQTLFNSTTRIIVPNHSLFSAGGIYGGNLFGGLTGSLFWR